jgi:DNA-binding NarL/FixJ family response regulator
MSPSTTARRTTPDPDAPPLRVLVVDDHRAFAELLSMALDGESDIECVGIATSADQALAKVVDLDPDVVVVDIEMPDENGLAITRRIHQFRESTLVVVVTAHQSSTWIVRATWAGAVGYVPKNGSFTELVETVRHVRPGGMMVAPSALAPVSARPTCPEDPRSTEHLIRLTGREQDVLACMSQGMAPKATARVLGISVHTCRGYVKTVLAKLGVSSQLEAIVTARRIGLLAG